VCWGCAVVGWFNEGCKELSGTVLEGLMGTLVTSEVLEQDSIMGSVGGRGAAEYLEVEGGCGACFQLKTLALMLKR
jgi:hypothetical protein